MAVGVRAKLAELMRYGGVGVLAALIHALVLLGGEGLGAALPLANLLGFLLASLWGYLAHALFTFREHTGGTPFPRRWLVIQTGVNVLLSLLLPGWLAGWARTAGGTLVMVFTPTAVNYVIWSLAARHSAQRRARSQRLEPQSLLFHADDLGLDPAVNAAIVRLHDAGALHSASVLVTAPAVQEAVALSGSRPQLQLALHLCLSEGLPAAAPAAIPDLLDSQGRLALGVGRLLLSGLLPVGAPRRRRLEEQLGRELRAQVERFQQLFPDRPLLLDGHQHLHLLPLVWLQLLQLPPPLRPLWIRTLREPWPWRGISPSTWWHSCQALGPLKWLLLRLLNRGRAAELARLGIATNPGFSGVLFTGLMDGAVMAAAERRLSGGGLVLAHPSEPWPAGAELPAYPLSSRFYRSSWRQREADALMRRTR